MFWLRYLILLGLTLVLPLHGAEAKEFGTLREIVADAAKELLELVNGQPVSIGEFRAVGKRNLNSGPEIEVLLRKSLKEMMAVVRDEGAPFEITGDYVFVESPEPEEAAKGQKVVRLNFQVVETKTGRAVKVPISRFLRNNTEIIQVLNVTGLISLDEKQNQTDQRRQRNLEIQKSFDRPTTFVDPDRPTLVGSAKESPYRIELVSCPVGNGKTRPTEPRKARVEKGLAFVDGIDRGDVYEIRIYNNSADEIAARLFIDGLDMFEFSLDRDPKDPSRPRLSHLIVPPAKDGMPETVIGWHKSLSGLPNYAAFLVTAYGLGASSKAGIPATGPVGVIQVQFSKCHERGTGGRSKSPANETGEGPPRFAKQKAVVREIEPPTDVVTIRYTR